MEKIKGILLLIITFLSLASLSFAADMSQGLQCPSGWSDNMAARSKELIKQCISPNQDAFIELYAAPGQQVPLGKLLDAWASGMTQQGLPFQNLASEQPGHVSGFPAIYRIYSGHTRNGAHFDSSIVASSYNGIVYIFQGLSMKGHDQARQQIRHAMNAWHYPGTSQQATNNQIGNLPLGAGSSSNTPYVNDPYGNTQPQSQAPISIKIDRHGSGCEAMLKIYDNKGLILDFQSTYVGSKPFNDETLVANWKSTKYQKFFKITTHNHSDSEIRFIKIATDAYKEMNQYCAKPNGKKYFCGRAKKSSRNLGSSSTALRINGKHTNTLLPGQTSVKQGYNTFSSADFRGKKNKYTYFFIYKGKTFNFETCRQF